MDVIRIGESISTHICRDGEGLCVRTSVICTPTRSWVEFLTLDGRFLDKDGNVFMIKVGKDGLDMDFRSKYTGAQIEALLDKINNGDIEADPIVVDSELSLTSENPVQNRIITEAIRTMDDDIEALDNKVAHADSTFEWSSVD